MGTFTGEAGWRQRIALALAFVGILALVWGAGSVQAASTYQFDNETNSTTSTDSTWDTNSTSDTNSTNSTDGTDSTEDTDSTSDGTGDATSTELFGRTTDSITDSTSGVEITVGSTRIDGTLLDDATREVSSRPDGGADDTTAAVASTADSVGSTLEGSGGGTDDGTGTLTDLLGSGDTIGITVELVGSSTGESTTSVRHVEAAPDEGRERVAVGTFLPPGSTTDSGMEGAGSGLSDGGPDVPRDSPAGAAAFGLGAVLAGVGVGFRQLTAASAPVQALALTAQRGFDRVRLPRLFAPLRYSRYDDSDPLEHEDRADVFEVVDESPGIYLTQLSETLDVSVSTLRHHVKVLEREDLIAGSRVRGRRRFYPTHAEQVELAAAMNDEATASIVDALARLGASSVSDLADAVDRDASTLTYHLQRLEDDGLVVRERDGRAILNRLSADARTAIAPSRGAEAPDEESGEADEEVAISAD